MAKKAESEHLIVPKINRGGALYLGDMLCLHFHNALLSGNAATLSAAIWSWVNTTRLTPQSCAAVGFSSHWVVTDYGYIKRRVDVQCTFATQPLDAPSWAQASELFLVFSCCLPLCSFFYYITFLQRKCLYHLLCFLTGIIDVFWRRLKQHINN